MRYKRLGIPINLSDTSDYHEAAYAELKKKINLSTKRFYEPLLINSPPKTVIRIRAGCVSKKVAANICRSFNSDGFKTTLHKGGLIHTKYYLIVNLSIAQILARDVKNGTTYL